MRDDSTGNSMPLKEARGNESKTEGMDYLAAGMRPGGAAGAAAAGVRACGFVTSTRMLPA